MCIICMNRGNVYKHVGVFLCGGPSKKTPVCGKHLAEYIRKHSPIFVTYNGAF